MQFSDKEGLKICNNGEIVAFEEGSEQPQGYSNPGHFEATGTRYPPHQGSGRYPDTNGSHENRYPEATGDEHDEHEHDSENVRG